MYPGPDDPDLGVFVRADGGRARARADTSVERAVLDRRGGGKRRYLELAPGPRGSAPSGRTSSTPTSSSRPGSSPRSRGGAPLVVTAHGRDVRNVGAIPGIARRDALRRPPRARGDRRLGLPPRELEAKIPEARGKTEVVDCGVDLERFPVLARAGRDARVRLHRLADRAQERRPPRRTRSSASARGR